MIPPAARLRFGLLERDGLGFRRIVLLLLALAALSPRPAEARTRPVAPVNVVLVHGILDTGRRFNPMIEVLREAGCDCFAPSLRPNDCRYGVRDLSIKLAAQIDAHFGKSQPFFLVGYSLGGLVTRDYVQNLADRRRVRGVFLISTPNHGTVLADASPFPALRELCAGSDFLRMLNAGDAAWKGIPVSSYWTPFDCIIVPATSSLWPVGETRRVYCLLHPWMVKDRVVLADILGKIQRPPAAAPRRRGRFAGSSARPPGR